MIKKLNRRKPRSILKSFEDCVLCLGSNGAYYTQAERNAWDQHIRNMAYLRQTALVKVDELASYWCAIRDWAEVGPERMMLTISSPGNVALPLQMAGPSDEYFSGFFPSGTSERRPVTISPAIDLLMTPPSPGDLELQPQIADDAAEGGCPDDSSRCISGPAWPVPHQVCMSCYDDTTPQMTEYVAVTKKLMQLEVCAECSQHTARQKEDGFERKDVSAPRSSERPRTATGGDGGGVVFLVIGKGAEPAELFLHHGEEESLFDTMLGRKKNRGEIVGAVSLFTKELLPFTEGLTLISAGPEIPVSRCVTSMRMLTHVAIARFGSSDATILVVHLTSSSKDEPLYTLDAGSV
ncbi:MAG: hypothetical protein M1812_004363 [Candelaria pacifica]|nr:MAG: hypothetical protein M1812_004363 [Candelaria pacifica]